MKANKAGLEILGIKEENLVGLPVQWLIDNGYNSESVIMNVIKSITDGQREPFSSGFILPPERDYNCHTTTKGQKGRYSGLDRPFSPKIQYQQENFSLCGGKANPLSLAG